MIDKPKEWAGQLLAEAEARYQADRALRLSLNQPADASVYKWGPAPPHIGLPVAPLRALQILLRSLGGWNSTVRLNSASLGSRRDPNYVGVHVGCAASRLRDDYIYWPPPESFYTRLRDLLEPVPKTPDKWWTTIDRLNDDLCRASLKDGAKIPPKGVQQVVLAAYNLAAHEGWTIPHPPSVGLIGEVTKWFKSIVSVGKELYDMAKAIEEGDIAEAAGAAGSAYKKLSATERRRLKLAADAGWFGPVPATWSQEDKELWELIKDAEI